MKFFSGHLKTHRHKNGSIWPTLLALSRGVVVSKRQRTRFRLFQKSKNFFFPKLRPIEFGKKKTKFWKKKFTIYGLILAKNEHQWTPKHARS